MRGYPFIALDDSKYVTANPHIKTLDGSTVVWAFTHVYSANWHPLTWISHALDVEMFGLEPGGHHLVNVTLHALNAVLLLWVLWKATGYVGRSFMVAALFALHPINVEAVVWIAERKTMLSTLFFFLLALGTYRWYASRPKLGRMAVVAFPLRAGAAGQTSGHNAAFPAASLGLLAAATDVRQRAGRLPGHRSN